MLGKLLKYDFKALFRNYGLLFAALFSVTILYKIFLFLPRNIVLDSMSTLMGALYVIVILGCLFGAGVINVMRFYKNLVTDEGYLTFTLPVSSKQIIVSKLISTLVMEFLMAAAVLLSLSFLRKDLPILDELYNVLGMYLKQMFALAEYRNLLTGFLVYFVIVCVYMQITVFTAVAIGQLSRMHKIAAGVGAYALLYFVTQCVMGVAVFLWAMKFNMYNVEVDMSYLSAIHPEIISAVGQILILIDVAIVILGAACFFLSDYLFSKKLNLE